MNLEATAQVLIEATLRTTLLAGIAALALRLFRIRSAGLQHACWTLVVAIGVGMPALRHALPPLTVALPPVIASSLPSEPALPTTGIAKPGNTPLAEVPNAPIVVRSSGLLRHPAPTRSASPFPPSIDWTSALAASYLIGVVLLTGKLLIGLAGGIYLRRSSRLLHGLAPVETRESGEITVPVTFGFWKPVILLPADWQRWDARKLEAVLLHESAHVAQGDYLRQLLAQLHAGLFWLNPLSWWLRRRLAELSEQTVDDLVLRKFVDRYYYAEILVGFLKARNQNNRLLWSSIAMANSSSFGNRIDRILTGANSPARGVSRLSRLVLAACTLPVVLLAASIHLVETVPPPPEPPVPPQAVRSVPAPSAPAAPPAPAARPAPVAPSVPVAPAAPMTPAAPVTSAPVPESNPTAPAAEVPATPTTPPVVSAPAVPTPIAPPPPPIARPTSVLAPVAQATPRAPRFAAQVTPMPAVPPPPAAAGTAPPPPPPPPSPTTLSPAESWVIVTPGRQMSRGSRQDQARGLSFRSKVNGDYIWLKRDGVEYLIQDARTIAMLLDTDSSNVAFQQEAMLLQAAVKENLEAQRLQLPRLQEQLSKLSAELSELRNQNIQGQASESQKSAQEALQRTQHELQRVATAIDKVRLESMQAERAGNMARSQEARARAVESEMRQRQARIRALIDEAVQSGKAKPVQ